MSEPRQSDDSPDKRSRLFIAGGAVALLAAGIWFFADQEKVPEPKEQAAAEEAPGEEALAKEARAAEPEHVHAPPPSPATTTASAPATDQGPPPSHPNSPERERIQLENRFVQNLNDAMDNKDAPTLRKLVEEYRHEGFEDTDRKADAYELVANCIEHPGPESRAAAQAFWDKERASIMRRHLHRHCLE